MTSFSLSLFSPLSLCVMTGGFGGNVGHDPHLLYTLSAVQILAMYDALGAVDTEKIVSCEFSLCLFPGFSLQLHILRVLYAVVKNLQQPDGSFFGDKWGEVDTRFSYCALSCLSLLGKMDVVNVPKAVDFIVQCKNFDGGFGSRPGAESHAGQSKNHLPCFSFKPCCLKSLAFFFFFASFLLCWGPGNHRFSSLG